MDFKEQYKHPLWQKKRLEALEGAEYMCERCYDKDSQLHVHHKRYVKGRMIWEYKTTELSVLCGDCHESAHSEKDVFSLIIAQLSSSAMDELIPLIAGYCNEIQSHAHGEMSGAIAYCGERVEVAAGMVAAELCNRNIDFDSIIALYGVLQNSRIQGKRMTFSMLEKDNG